MAEREAPPDAFGRTAREYELGRPSWPEELLKRVCARLELGPAFLQVVQDFVRHALWPILASIFLAVLTARATPGLAWRDRLRAHPGLAVLLTAAALLPTSLAGRLKYGGAEVSFAPTLTRE